MPHLSYVDLVLFHEQSIQTREPLLKRHAYSLGYLRHLPDRYVPVAIQGAAFTDEFAQNGVQYRVRRGSNHFFALPLRLFAEIRSMQPDFVLLHGLKFAWQLLWLKYFLPAKTKLLVQNQGESPYPRKKAWVQQWAARGVDGFLFVNRDQAEPWQRRGIIRPGQKIFEVMEGATDFTEQDRARCRQKLSLPSGPVFLWVGRLDANKDPLTILKAFRQFKTWGHPFRLYLIYHKNTLEAEVVRFISENDLGNEVKLVGKVAHAEMETWYNAADYFVLGSHHEGSGFALSEAMACGCVPIVTDIPSFRSMTDQGRCGMLFEPENVVQLSFLLQQTTKLAADGLRMEVRRHFQKHLSHQAIAGQIDRVCQELINEHQAIDDTPSHADRTRLESRL